MLRKRTSSRSDPMMICNRIHLAGMLLGSMLFIPDACLVQFVFHCASHSTEHHVKKKKKSTIASGKVGVPLILHRRRTSEWREEEHPHWTSRMFLLAPPVICHSNAVQVKTLFSLCFPHRHSWILLVQCRRLANCDGSNRKRKVSLHTTPIHCIASALRDLHSYKSETYTLTQTTSTTTACKLPNAD